MFRFVSYLIVGAILVIMPLLLSPYFHSMMTQILIFSIFAMSLNFVFGYTGLFSLGHAAYLGVAGYGSAILVLRYGVKSFWLAAPAGILMAVVLAAIFGILALRVAGIYFLFTTLALGELVASVALKWRSMTGGTNGLTGIPYPDLGLPFTMNANSFYYFALIIFAVSYFLMYRLINSPFGLALQGIRDDETRAQCLGYNTWLYKYVAFIISGFFAGVAGVLFAPFSGTLVPSHLGVMTSTLVMLMVIIGSDRIVFGPVVGATVVLFLQYSASIYAPARWPFILGGVFVLSVMFLRQGISVHLVRFWSKVIYSYGNASG
jgi:branched-chain amino acid transport system permease protein